MFQKKKSDKKKLEVCQNDFIFKKIFELYQVIRYSQRFQVSSCSNNPNLYTLKALLNKNWIYFFFLIF